MNKYQLDIIKHMIVQDSFQVLKKKVFHILTYIKI